MISAELLEILRCPMDPLRNARLSQADNHLVCQRCGLCFPVKDGFPVLVVEEAALPAGCSNLEQLPCQHQTPAAARGG